MNLFNAVNKYRRARWLYLHHLKAFAYLYRCWIYLIHNSYIPPSCEIGKNTVFGYKGIGVVVHANAKIGDNCVIGTNVTIGSEAGRSNKRIKEFDDLRREEPIPVPVIGNGVKVYNGAIIAGSVVIGDGAIIGANAVVVNDVPCNAVVGGVPAKILYINNSERQNG